MSMSSTSAPGTRGCYRRMKFTHQPIRREKFYTVVHLPIPYPFNTYNRANVCESVCAVWELSGSVVECFTRDQRAAGSILTGVTALCP